MNVYDCIKSLCDEKGIAVTALEKELGFGRGSIGKLKKGGSTTADRLRKIADFFGVSVADLMTNNVSSYDPDLQYINDVWQLLSDTDKLEIITLIQLKVKKYDRKEMRISG